VDDLKVSIQELGADAERLEGLTIALRRDLLGLDVGDVHRPRGGPLPSGSRAIDMAAAGELVVVIGGQLDALTHILSTIRSWMSRGSGSGPRSVELTLDGKTLRLSSASEEEQQQLIGEFVRALDRT
jgi:hypothetical protein